MKNLKRILIAALAILAVGTTASAQFKWGVKAGVNINKIHFDKNIVNDLADADNHAGYQFGVQAEFTVPIIGVGFDTGLMFNHRKIGDGEDGSSNFLDVPLHLRYKFGLPGLGQLLTPYLFVGPDFAVNLGKEDIEEGVTRKKFDVFLDLGLGFEIVKHLQLSAHYAWGLTKAYNFVAGGTPAFTAKINGWTISAAYIF